MQFNLNLISYEWFHIRGKTLEGLPCILQLISEIITSSSNDICLNSLDSFLSVPSFVKIFESASCDYGIVEEN